LKECRSDFFLKAPRTHTINGYKEADMQELQHFFTVENLSGTVAAVTSLIGLLPQVYKSYRTKSTVDVSMAMLINYLICSIAWVIYGLCTDSNFVLCSNVIGSVIALISIAQKAVYDKNSRRSVPL
jgi:MtN3 and saliva related transmembrane protein